jgi:hypothetical protein
MIGCQPLSTDRQSGVQLHGTSRELRIQSHRVARRPVEAGGTRCRPRCRVVGERRPAPRASRTDGQEPAHLILVETGRQLAAYFAGNLKAFNIPLDIKGTEFQKRVWAALLTMPFGLARPAAVAKSHAGSVTPRPCARWAPRTAATLSRSSPRATEWWGLPAR